MSLTQRLCAIDLTVNTCTRGVFPSKQSAQDVKRDVDEYWLGESGIYLVGDQIKFCAESEFGTSNSFAISLTQR